MHGPAACSEKKEKTKKLKLSWQEVSFDKPLKGAVLELYQEQHSKLSVHRVRILEQLTLVGNVPLFEVYTQSEQFDPERGVWVKSLRDPYGVEMFRQDEEILKSSGVYELPNGILVFFMNLSCVSVIYPAGTAPNCEPWFHKANMTGQLAHEPNFAGDGFGSYVSMVMPLSFPKSEESLGEAAGYLHKLSLIPASYKCGYTQRIIEFLWSSDKTSRSSVNTALWHFILRYKPVKIRFLNAPAFI